MAARLIDAYALMETLGIAEECEYCQYSYGGFCSKSSDFVDACEAIADAPTVTGWPKSRNHGREEKDETNRCGCF